MPRSPDLGIFVQMTEMTDTTNYFTPCCTCAHRVTMQDSVPCIKIVDNVIFVVLCSMN